MARAHRSRNLHYRCAQCRSPIPYGYLRCLSCGHVHQTQEAQDRTDELVERIKRAFPGTREELP